MSSPVELERYCFDFTSAEPKYLERLLMLTDEHMSYTKKISGRLVGRALKLLVAISGARRILEIGTFTGYSALSMAEALPADGIVISLESNPKAATFAHSFISQYTAFSDKIDIRQGLAIETIPTLDGPFDLVFIDADKRNYADYFSLVFSKVKVGGLIVIDNALWGGRVLEPEADSDWGVARLNQQVLLDGRVENVLLNVRDGLNLVRKLDD